MACASDTYEMAPAKPPLPMPWNFPFQPAAGIHTSNSIWESLVGRITPTTLQNAGRRSRGVPSGGVNVPEVLTAMVIVVSGSRRFERLSQGWGAAVAWLAPARNDNRVVASRRRLIGPR